MKLMFSLPKATLKETFDRLSSKAPETLTAQFPNRASKGEAVKSYKERQKISTKLFPAGKISPLVQCIFLRFTQITNWSFNSCLSSDTKCKIREKKKIELVYFYFDRKLTLSYNSVSTGEKQNVLQERMQTQTTSRSKASKTARVSRKSNSLHECVQKESKSASKLTF